MSFIEFLSNCLSRKNVREKDNMETNKEIYLKKIQGKLGHLASRNSSLSNTMDEKDTNLIRRDSDSNSRNGGARKGCSTDESSTNDDLETFSEPGDSFVLTQADWLQIIKNTTVDLMSYSELVNSLRHGIPDEIRPIVWEFLTNIESLRKQYSPGYYNELKSKESPADTAIEKDTSRTYSEHPFFIDNETGQAHLRNILRAYANHDKQVGYTQGMNYVAGMLLIILDPNNYKNSNLSYYKNYEEEFEEKTFWILTYILCVKNFRILYKNELPKFHELTKSLDLKIKSKAPEVHALIRTNELEVAQVFQEKLLSMLLSQTPVPLASVILDMFFIDEERILFKVLIRSILICRKEILELHDSMDLLTFFNKRLLQVAYEKCKDRIYLLFPGPEQAD